MKNVTQQRDETLHPLTGRLAELRDKAQLLYEDAYNNCTPEELANIHYLWGDETRRKSTHARLVVQDWLLTEEAGLAESHIKFGVQYAIMAHLALYVGPQGR